MLVEPAFRRRWCPEAPRGIGRGGEAQSWARLAKSEDNAPTGASCASNRTAEPSDRFNSTGDCFRSLHRHRSNRDVSGAMFDPRRASGPARAASWALSCRDMAQSIPARRQRRRGDDFARRLPPSRGAAQRRARSWGRPARGARRVGASKIRAAGKGEAVGLFAARSRPADARISPVEGTRALGDVSRPALSWDSGFGARRGSGHSFRPRQHRFRSSRCSTLRRCCRCCGRTWCWPVPRYAAGTASGRSWLPRRHMFRSSGCSRPRRRCRCSARSSR
jgi:hypothetical protein